jgi:hypothetical protein
MSYKIGSVCITDLLSPNQYAAMQRRLGYRIQVTQATTPNTANRGQNYTVSVNLINNGFSKLMNSRSMYLAFLHPGVATYVAPVPFSCGIIPSNPLAHLRRVQKSGSWARLFGVTAFTDCSRSTSISA